MRNGFLSDYLLARFVCTWITADAVSLLFLLYCLYTTDAEEKQVVGLQLQCKITRQFEVPNE
jgi:hypothetical protein